jgi:prolipoprotein diacylglyceryl transferase
MLTSPLFINWNPSLGPFGSIRWYSICWALGLLAGYFIMQRLYKQQKIKQELFEPLFLYCFIGIFVGARLGHCLFYEPNYFLSGVKPFIEMFVPIRFLPDGGWKYIGYEGLASHGGTLGLMIALYLYVRKTHLPLRMVLDNIAITTPIVACLIRIGNLMNSEIIGKPTDVPWAFVFERVDALPRHPGQLYEAIVYLVIFIVGLQLHKRFPKKVGTGFYFGFCLTTIFTARFFIEYTKEIQSAFEAALPIDMGQILSIPFILLGVYCMHKGWKKEV